MSTILGVRAAGNLPPPEGRTFNDWRLEEGFGSSVMETIAEMKRLEDEAAEILAYLEREKRRWLA